MVFVSAATVLVSFLLGSSLVHAAPQGLPESTNNTIIDAPVTDAPTVDSPTLLDIPIAPLGSSPVSAIEDAFKSLRSDKISTSEFSIMAVKTTRNDIIEKRACSKVIIIFARGTTEPGNVGDDVGPYFFDALSAKKPGMVNVQGVNNYPADVWGYLGGGSDTGAADMANSVKLAATQCPNAQIVLSGFSQGAQVVHKAAKKIPSSLYSKISAIVLFGDPNNGDPFPGALNANVKTFCHLGDLICLGWPIPLPPHMTYELDAPAAAGYLIGRLSF